MAEPLLRRITPAEVARASRPPVDETTRKVAFAIVEDVRTDGERAVRAYAEQFGERSPADPLVLDRAAMAGALDRIATDDRALLERVAARIQNFAQAQRDAIRPVTSDVPGGQAGHTVEPVRSAGCYAPGGRYPLPSSVLMTAVTARVAGCERVVVATPASNDIMLAAASIAGADTVLIAGGAHAVAAMAYGFDGFERCDVIAGPGNRWVTAAKQIVSGVVGIDMLAGPSELLIIADDSADPALVAADLLAQAEHDADASAMLVTDSTALADRVERALGEQLATLPTAPVARQALRNGWACVCDDIAACVRLSDAVSPEHLEIITRDAVTVAAAIQNAGGVFIGAASAEVLGDYGAGPNHTLPTGGTARFQAGLSVMHFLRLRTWLRIDDAARASGLRDDTERLARIEGLAGHARAAATRGM